MTCERHIEEGAPHTKWHHAAFINYDGVLLLVFLVTDELMKKVEDGVCRILDIVEVRYRHMCESDAHDIVAQSLELGS